MNNILYYPYINVPKTDWTIRSLLYFDKVGSIVPLEYFKEPDFYEPFMKEMVKNELIEPINPIDVLNELSLVSKAFIEYMNGNDFDLQERRRNFSMGRLGVIHNDKFAYGSYEIHSNKFDSEIFYHLEHSGLALRNNSSWFYVEQQTANELMVFLASIIGEKLKYQLTTDNYEFNFQYGKKKDYQIDPIAYDKRVLILKELIPFPEEIDIKKIKAFKDKHSELLKAFYNRVELIVLNSEIEIESKLFKEAIQELKIRKEELSVKMNEGKLGSVIFGTICGVVGAFIGLSTTSGVGALFGGLPGFANAIYSALKIEKAENIFDQSGLKYLALIDKKIRK